MSETVNNYFETLLAVCVILAIVGSILDYFFIIKYLRHGRDTLERFCLKLKFELRLSGLVFLGYIGWGISMLVLKLNFFIGIIILYNIIIYYKRIRNNLNLLNMLTEIKEQTGINNIQCIIENVNNTKK